MEDQGAYSQDDYNICEWHINSGALSYTSLATNQVIIIDDWQPLKDQVRWNRNHMAIGSMGKELELLQVNQSRI